MDVHPLLKQQSLITVYRLPTKENKFPIVPFPFSAIKRKLSVSVFHLQQTN
jgi:hypothetical protein